jgi:hypothetical protein
MERRFVRSMAAGILTASDRPSDSAERGQLPLQRRLVAERELFRVRFQEENRAG